MDDEKKIDPKMAKDKQKGSASSGGSVKSRKGLVIAIVALVVVIAVATVAYNMLAPTVTAPSTMNVASSSASVDGMTAKGTDASADEGEKSDAPDFTMTTVDGESMNLSSFEGRPVVLNFWASTCGPCQREMPEFQKAFERYGGEVDFVMLNALGFNGESRERAMQFIAQNSYDFPVYFDSSSEASMLYGVNSIPRTFFISADGKVEAYIAGTIDGSVLDQGIGMIVK